MAKGNEGDFSLVLLFKPRVSSSAVKTLDLNFDYSTRQVYAPRPVEGIALEPT